MVWCDKLKNKMFCHLEKIFLFCFQLRPEFCFLPLDLRPPCGSGSRRSPKMRFRFRNIRCWNCFSQCCGAGAGGEKLFWDLEPEPKKNFNKHFLQSVLRMLG